MVCRSIGAGEWGVSCIDQYVSDRTWQTASHSVAEVARKGEGKSPAMEYPHWLIVAGALLLMLGLFGLSLRRRSDEGNPPEKTSNQAPSEPEHQPTRLEVYNLTAKEKRRDRWAERAAPIGSRIDLWPKKESDMPEWQAAIETLMLCSRGGHAILADWRGLPRRSLGL